MLSVLIESNFLHVGNVRSGKKWFKYLESPHLAEMTSMTLNWQLMILRIEKLFNDSSKPHRIFVNTSIVL